MHHVHAASALQIVQQVVHRLPHQRTPGFHGLGGEVAVHHLALFLVLRPVVLGEAGGHPLAHRREQLHILFGDGRGRGLVVAQGYLGGKILGVSGGPNEPFVAGHHPHLVLLVPVYRRFRPPSAEVAIRVADGVGREEVIVGMVRHERTPLWAGWCAVKLSQAMQQFKRTDGGTDDGPPLEKAMGRPGSRQAAMRYLALVTETGRASTARKVSTRSYCTSSNGISSSTLSKRLARLRKIS